MTYIQVFLRLTTNNFTLQHFMSKIQHKIFSYTTLEIINDVNYMCLIFTIYYNFTSFYCVIIVN